jgi:DNA-binding CsgD family transcriptional regulator
VAYQKAGVGSIQEGWNLMYNLNRTPKPTAPTKRELEIARYIALGKRQKEIGVILDISLNTVKNHIISLRRKYGLSGQVEVALWFIRYTAKDGEGK